jgi:hypothetical protein
VAFTVEDFQDLVRLLEEHPEWRAQLRPVILGEEILAIPSRMDRVEAALLSVTERLDKLTERVDALTLAVRALTERADRADGRMGNIEGQLLELRYDQRAKTWFSEWLRRPTMVGTDDLEERTLGLAVEVAHTINVEDVARAHARARLLERAGHPSRAFVGGYRIGDDARRLADELDVVVDLHRPPA